MSRLLFPEEAVEADQGYGGDNKLKTADMGDHRVDRKMKANARAQHEAVNSRLKQFNVLTTHFRHMKPQREMMNKHKMCFEAVAVITQLKFMAGMTIFNDGLDYDVAYW